MASYEEGDEVRVRTETGGEKVYLVIDALDDYFVGEEVFGTEIAEIPYTKVISTHHSLDDEMVFGRPSQSL